MEEEKEADEKAFKKAKNIFQRAIHAVNNLNLKNKFCNSYSIIEENEPIEMAKHNSNNITLLKK